MKRLCLVTFLLVITTLLGTAAATAQTNMVNNGDFEGGFAYMGFSDCLDGTADNIPNGWNRYETFSGGVPESSALSQFLDNGPSLAGAFSLWVNRWPDGGLSGDWSAVYQDLNIDASQCSALILNMDVKVFAHDLPAGGFVCNSFPAFPAFEWPVVVQINYTTTGGATQVWRHGWYLGNDSVSPEPAGEPGDLGCPATFPVCPGSSADDCGDGLIAVFNDEEVTSGVWDANSFDLLAELPQVDTITRIYVGGSGWNFDGRVDNVEILCTPRVAPGVPTLSEWGIVAMIIALGGSALWLSKRKTVGSKA